MLYNLTSRKDCVWCTIMDAFRAVLLGLLVAPVRIAASPLRVSVNDLELHKSENAPGNCLDVKMEGGYSGTICGANSSVPHSKKCLLMIPGERIGRLHVMDV